MTQSPTRIVALIVAAGQSQRMGGDTPKQYRRLADKSVLRRSIEAFLQHPDVSDVCVVIHPDHEALYAAATDGLKLLPPVHGGATRQQSVQQGAEYLATTDATHVLVHDAARCFVDAATISRVIAALQNGAEAVVPSLPVADTLKTVTEGKAINTLKREKIHFIQTPQGFDIKILNNLHLNKNSENATDDAALAEAAGIAVQCVTGSSRNFKLTTAEDWERAEMMMQQPRIPRTGMGYDVHRLIPRSDDGRELMLCGIKIAHDHVLEGHSDADVGLHALTDALLGAMALGDIGTHFPPSDARWKGADSAQFVTYCRQKMLELGAELHHVDITLICEAPRIGPHRAAMQARVAALLAIDEANVSIKATTTEGLGFCGRREGIAAQAVATLSYPQRAIL